jgi:small nuclear ribonucleoprotein (snRNP)-like protein
MKDENEIKQIAVEIETGVIAALNVKFEELFGKLEDFEETLNDTLEQVSERQYTREANDLFEA